jgi:2,5-diamino-6-(ribosylamino)-4(3H)-pyrimidinone 5'-phosphate reductase
MNRPHTIMLVAVSLDGKISPDRKPGQPNPVGPSLIDADIMALHNARRARVDGIMVGLNCILLDDSRLTLRDGRGKNPTRIVLDGLAEMSVDARVLNDDASTIVGVTADAPRERVDALKAKGVRIIVAGRGKFVALPPLMSELSDRYGIRNLLVEGGGTVHRSMIADNLYDELHLIMCPFIIGGAGSITPAESAAFWPGEAIPRFKLEKADRIGDYLYIVYRPIISVKCEV